MSGKPDTAKDPALDQTMRIQIKGRSPLICQRWSQEVKERVFGPKRAPCLWYQEGDKS